MITIKELLVKLNELRLEADKPPLTTWKQSRQKLEDAIDALVLDVPEVVTEDSTDVSDVVQEEVQAEAVEATQSEELPVEKVPRGAIGAMSIELLADTDLPYLEIVERIKKAYPSAKTTPRSLASVAMDLRRDGIQVPSRRKPAKTKVEKTV